MLQYHLLTQELHRTQGHLRHVSVCLVFIGHMASVLCPKMKKKLMQSE